MRPAEGVGLIKRYFVSFSFGPGAVFAVVGPNGAGRLRDDFLYFHGFAGDGRRRDHAVA